MSGSNEVVHRVLVRVVAALLTLASGLGLAVDGLYRDNAFVQAAWYGNDLVSLTVGLPVFALSLVLMRRGDVRGTLLGLGMLAYAAYNYAFYLFGAAYNALFLLYVALFSGSMLGLIAGLASDRLTTFRQRLRLSPSDRAWGGLALVICVGLGGFWVTVSVGSLVNGEQPAMIAATGHPTNVTGALDLSLVVPFGLLGGIWLIRGRAWGHVVATIWAVKGAVYMAALSAAAVTAYRRGLTASPAELALWAPIGLACALVAVALLRSASRGSASSAEPGNDEPR